MRFYSSPTSAKLILLFSGFLLLSLPTIAQRPSSETQPPEFTLMTVKVCVRDSHGLPLDAPAMVRLHSVVASYDVRNPTQEGSTATFPKVKQGEYEAEVHALGYKVTVEPVSVASIGGEFTVYVYVQKESSDPAATAAPTGVVMSPKLQNEIDKGLLAMRKQQYDAAKEHFTKASALAPGNPDVVYLLGTVELALHHPSLARAQFESALKIEPTNPRALLSLGELQLQTGDLAGAITTLERAYDVNGADWRIHCLLATAYARSGRLAEAETHAARAASLAKGKGAFATYLLGEIQFAEHKTSAATETWQRLLAEFPGDPLVAKTQERLASATGTPGKKQNETQSESVPDTNVNAPLPLAATPMIALAPVPERPWAPPDIDSNEYRLAEGAVCNLNDVLARAERRLKSQLKNFEKFTATERIEHQEINRYGTPGPVKSKEFSYVVFVQPVYGDSVYLDEHRLAENDSFTFPTSLATTGLNALGVSVLQPYLKDSYNYQCEGLANLRGQAAWQIRFEEKMGAGNSIREWRKNGEIVELPLKGRFWLASSTFDLLRIETDLAKPVTKLELTRDHLIVDYGPVNFQDGKIKLWLPWKAEMFMELHGRRYHHKHYLTDYLLFAVDIDHKIAAPKAASSASPEANP